MVTKSGSRRVRSDLPNGQQSALPLEGRVRQQKYFQHLKYFLGAVIVCLILQCFLYWLLSRDIFPRKPEAFQLLGASMFLPLCVAAAVLTAFRRHESPVLSAAIVYGAAYLAMIAIVSATRMPLSYTAIFCCFPIGGFGIAWANYRFNRAYSSNICLMLDGETSELAARFPKARIIKQIPDNLEQFELDFDTLVIGEAFDDVQRYNEFLRHMYLSGVDVVPAPVFAEIVFGKTDPDKFEVFHLSYSFSQIIYYRAKRYLDILLVLLLLPITLPILLASAAFIFARDPGQVIFVQLRKGYGGGNFRIFKLRTMFADAGDGAATVGDRRVIPGCNFLRRYRIDELPQLLNILRGDMSFIGPRPESISIEKVYRRELPKYSLRLLVRPGLSGWAQVGQGYTGNVEEAKEKLAYDLYYIKHLSLDLDIAITLKTVKTILMGFGAR